MKNKIYFLVGMMALFYSSLTWAQIVIPMYATDSDGASQKIGEVVADDTPYGLLLTPNLHGLAPGIHGFHVHDMPFCGEKGMEAQGHLDPLHTGKHRGPYSGDGHLGDLPVLVVDANGDATLPVLAPRLKLDMIQQHSLMIHAGGDNYSDTPEKLGGGGARVACGVIGDHH